MPSHYELYGRAWYERNRETELLRAKETYQTTGKEQKKKAYPSRWETIIKSRYGITEEDYNKLFSEQSGVCAICKLPPTKKRLDIDHCHESKKVRGLLCNNCNRGLGHFKDSMKNLQAASEYLQCDITGKGGSCGV